MPFSLHGTTSIPFIVRSALVYSTTDTIKHTYTFNTGAAITSDLSQELKAGMWTDVARKTRTYDDANRPTSETAESLIRGILTPYYRSRYDYDPSGRLIAVIHEQRDDPTHAWVILERWTLGYDGTGAIVLDQRESLFQGFTITGSRTTYTRDQAGHELVQLHESWDTGWTNFSRTTHSWGAHDLWLMETYEKWANGRWTNVYRYRMTYDERDNLLVDAYDEWVKEQWQPGSRVTRTFDALNNETSWLLQGDTTGQLTNAWRTTQTFTGHLMTGGSSERWKDTAWILSSRWSDGYDANGDRVMHLTEGWTGSSWENLSRTVATYDAARRQTLDLTEAWSLGQWKPRYRRDWAYDGAGNQTLLLFQTWNADTLRMGQRTTSSFDPNGIPLAFAYETWSNGSWRPTDQHWWFTDSAAIPGVDMVGGPHNTYTFTASRVELSGEVLRNGSSAPSSYALMQNYPNPFNAGTTIRYTLPETQWVRLSVYDILGQEIVRLVNGQQAVGTFDVHLDATRLSSGVYFSFLSAGPFTDVRKMIVLK